MCKNDKLIAHHNHSYFSNYRLIDAIASPKELLTTAHKLGYNGLSITEHETISSSVEILNELKSLKEQKLISQDFKVILGNEAYVVDSLEDVRDSYQSGVTKFPHQILLAKNRTGFEAISKLSSHAWSNSFFTGTMERVPTDKVFLEQVTLSDEYKGTLIATSACLGSRINLYLQEYKETNNPQAYENAVQEAEWYKRVFGKENFFIELQPANTELQRYVNKHLVRIADELELDYLVACDTHYARPEDRQIHKAFLNSKEGDREVDEFYYYTYMHSIDEIYKHMEDYLGKDVVKRAIENTTKLYDMCEDYTLDNSPIIPKITIPEFEVKHLFKRAYDKYQYIKELAESEVEDNQYFLYLIEQGFIKELYHQDISSEKFHNILERINLELREILGISERLNDNMSSYYLSCREIVNIMWDDSSCGGDSLVGSGRGSGAGFLINYLLGITQINPLEYVNMPHERHLSKERVELPDLDLDCESSKRERIIGALKHHFGESKVLQVSTYGTEGSKSAIKTASKGLGIEDTEAQYIASFIPSERGQQWSISDCLYGNADKERKPVAQFKREMEKYDGLIDVALKIEGIVTRRGIHAGGVIIFNDEPYKTNAMMKGAKGKAQITQFNLKDSEQTGGVKYDILSIDNLDRIRATLDLLEEENLVDTSNGLRKTFETLLHPKNLNLEDKEYFKLASENKVADLFQFNTTIGQDTLRKVKPETFEDFCSANSLMRLQATDGGEQPIDIFIRHKNDMQIWYDEMYDFGLNEREVEILKEHLDIHKGVNHTQEISMALSADERISNFNIVEQNALRKAIAKPKGAALEQVKETFYRKGEQNGARKVFLDYIWDVQFSMQFSYSFSSLHTTAYSIIGIQNLELNKRFNPIYWQTACLNVDSGTLDGDDVDYKRIGLAIGKMKSQGVSVALPNINLSKITFTPNTETNEITYGLGAIKHINNDVANEIIKHRPYSNFNDFLTRMCDTKIVKNQQLISLIKSGVFDSFGERKDIMKQGVTYLTDIKDSYTLASINKLIKSGVLKDRKEYPIIMLREDMKQHVARTERSPKAKTPHKIFKVFDMTGYDKHGYEDAIVDVKNNYYEVDEKLFKKHFEKDIKDLKLWLQSEEAVNIVNRYELNESWKQYALGNYSSWEMESLTYYFNAHELEHINKESYAIVDFNTLPEEPEVEKTVTWGERELSLYKTMQIVGTVIGKNDLKHTVTLLTPTGVVNVKYYGDSYSHYNKQIKHDGKIVSRSWFSMGNKLIVHGFRRDSYFIARTYKHSFTQSTTKLITDIMNNGDVRVQTKR